MHLARIFLFYKSIAPKVWLDFNPANHKPLLCQITHEPAVLTSERWIMREIGSSEMVSIGAELI